MIIQARAWNFVQLLCLFCWPVRSISQRICEHVLPCRGSTQSSLREACPTPVIFSVAPAETRGSNISLYCSILMSFGLHSRRVHPKFSWSRHDVGSSKSTFFHQFLPHGSHIPLPSSHFYINPRIPIRTSYNNHLYTDHRDRLSCVTVSWQCRENVGMTRTNREV